MRSAGKDVLITGDFNGKSPTWGETRHDKRNIIVANTSHDFTFVRGDIGSIIDLTITSAGVARSIRDWGVLDEENQAPSWNTRKLDEGKLRRILKEARLIDEPNRVKRHENTEVLVEANRRKVIAACDACEPRNRFERKVQSSVLVERIAGKTFIDLPKGKQKPHEIQGKYFPEARVEKSEEGLHESHQAEPVHRLERPGCGSREGHKGFSVEDSYQEIGIYIEKPQGWTTRKQWKDVIVRPEELFTLKELKKAGAKLKTGNKKTYFFKFMPTPAKPILEISNLGKFFLF